VVRHKNVQDRKTILDILLASRLKVMVESYPLRLKFIWEHLG